MNNKEIDEEYRKKIEQWRREDEEKRMQEQFFQDMKRGCSISLIIIMLAILAFLILMTSCSRLERQSPNKVVYKHVVQKNADYTIYKVTEYSVSGEHYDTVRK